MNLQTARQSVSQMLTVWMTMLKLAWNHTTAALKIGSGDLNQLKVQHMSNSHQLQENLSSGSLSVQRYMCTQKGMNSTSSSRSATATPVRNRLIGDPFISCI